MTCTNITDDRNVHECKDIINGKQVMRVTTILKCGQALGIDGVTAMIMKYGGEIGQFSKCYFCSVDVRLMLYIFVM